jgi:hypothetical protein
MHRTLLAEASLDQVQPDDIPSMLRPSPPLPITSYLRLEDIRTIRRAITALVGETRVVDTAPRLYYPMPPRNNSPRSWPVSQMRRWHINSHIGMSTQALSNSTFRSEWLLL